VIPASKQPRPRRKPEGQPVPWAKVAIGASVVWMFVIAVFTIYFSLDGTPARPNEEALNVLPADQRARPAPVEKKVEPEEKKPVAKAKEPDDDLDFLPLPKNEFVDCAAIGTDVKFMKEPTEAFARARAERKLVFVMHLSGNLEDKDFT
jgi:hypothetical protein